MQKGQLDTSVVDSNDKIKSRSRKLLEYHIS